MTVLLASLILLFALAAVGAIALFQYMKFHGQRFVSCPDNGARVVVAVDAANAAFSTALGNPKLRLRECSRWPEKQDCGQECVRQIETAPADCLLRNVIARWYEDKVCVVCRHKIGPVHWHDHPPALADANGVTLEWKDVPAARLPEYLETHQPVCWNCHIVQTFRREHPDWIVERKER